MNDVEWLRHTAGLMQRIAELEEQVAGLRDQRDRARDFACALEAQVQFSVEDVESSL